MYTSFFLYVYLDEGVSRGKASFVWVKFCNCYCWFSNSTNLASFLGVLTWNECLSLILHVQANQCRTESVFSTRLASRRLASKLEIYQWMDGGWEIDGSFHETCSASHIWVVQVLTKILWAFLASTPSKTLLSRVFHCFQSRSVSARDNYWFSQANVFRTIQVCVGGTRVAWN